MIIVADGAYAKRPFMRRVQNAGGIIVSRLRKDAALFGLPIIPENPGKGRPRKYGKKPLSLAKRGGHKQGWTTETMTLYGKLQTVTYKTFLATYRPAGGLIRVVIVKSSSELFGDAQVKWVAFFCTDLDVSVQTILECVADRSAIEQNFHDVKEVHGAGQQQVRNMLSHSTANGLAQCNVACWNLCLWLHTLVELWSWRRSGNRLRQRDDRPWEATEAADR